MARSSIWRCSQDFFIVSISRTRLRRRESCPLRQTPFNVREKQVVNGALLLVYPYERVLGAALHKMR